MERAYESAAVRMGIRLRKHLIVWSHVARVGEHLEKGIMLQLVNALAYPVRAHEVNIRVEPADVLPVIGQPLDGNVD